MANVLRGESSFVSEAGETYHLVMDFNAFAEAEDAADMPVDDLLRAVSPVIDAKGNITRKPRIKHFGALLYGALKEKHPAITMPGAIRLLGEGEEIGAAIAKALQGAMPKPDASAEGKVPDKPGTGTKLKRTGRAKA